MSHEYHIVIALLESHAQASRRVLAKAVEEELVGLGYALRRVSKTFPLRVFAYGNEYFPDGAFYPGPIYPGFGRIGSFEIFEASLRQLHGNGELLVGCSSPVS
jgi:hypothetical protein